jgi:hydrogenase nickel incorporation protein HypA/HybF
MHELSLCQSMIRVVDAAMKDHKGAKLRRIFVDVGRGSTVESSLLREAFDVIVSGGPYDGVELVINDIPLAGRCRDCGRRFEYQEIALGCPACGSVGVDIESGLELSVRELEIDD